MHALQRWSKILPSNYQPLEGRDPADSAWMDSLESPQREQAVREGFLEEAALVEARVCCREEQEGPCLPEKVRWKVWYRQTEQIGNPGQLWLVEPEHAVGNGELEERLNRESVLESRIQTQDSQPFPDSWCLMTGQSHVTC